MADLPVLQLTLTPRLDAGSYVGFDVQLVVDVGPLEAGATLFELHTVVVGIPTAAYTAQQLEVADAAGPLPITQQEDQPDPSGVLRRWRTERAVEGPVTLRCFAATREVDRATPPGPLYDLRSQDRGIVGAGITFVPLPATDAVFCITLDWDLAEGQLGVSGRGEGTQRWKGTTESVSLLPLAAGTPGTAPDDAEPGGRTELGVYWFAEPTFDPDQLAGRLRRLFEQMATFFGAEERNYRVIARQQPHPGSGTAFPGAFMFGVSTTEATDDEELRDLLAHEMAHNWPRLDGDYPDTAWYSEGTAEYYSMLLQFRAGMTTETDLARQLTACARTYYTNPLHSLSNHELGERFWTDQRAQRAPYGRGLFHLIATDARISFVTDGAQSLDDVVLEVLKEQRAGDRVDNDGWVERLATRLGAEARAGHEAMTAGEWITPPETAFGGVLVSQETTDAELEVGFDISAFRGDRIVRGVVSGSAAERAGIRDRRRHRRGQTHAERAGAGPAHRADIAPR